MENLHELIAHKEKIEAQLLALPGVTSVDIGFKYKGGVKDDTQLVIRVWVVQKHDNVLPEFQIPKEIEGIPIDVMEGQAQYFQQFPTDRHATLVGGITIAPNEVYKMGDAIYAGRGTLGAIVYDNDTRKPLLLTNYHVMDVVDNKGDRIRRGLHGDKVNQPEWSPDGKNIVGSLMRFKLDEESDFALLMPNGSRYLSNAVLGIGAIKPQAVAPYPGMKVRKSGNTTGLTYGIIDGIASTVTVASGRTLKNQIVIVPDLTKNTVFSDEGDSGSLIVSEKNEAVGLLFAGVKMGNNGQQTTWANSMLVIQKKGHFSFSNPQVFSDTSVSMIAHLPELLSSVSTTTSPFSSLVSIQFPSIYKNNSGLRVDLPSRLAKCTKDTAKALHNLSKKVSEKGGKLVLSDLFRSYDMQMQAYLDHVNKKKKAFSPPPGGSMHEAGRAFDISLGDLHIPLSVFWELAKSEGIFPIIDTPDASISEAWHFDCRGSHQKVLDYYKQGKGTNLKPYTAMAVSSILALGMKVDAFKGREKEAYIQSGLIRLGQNIGNIDGHIGNMTFQGLRNIGILLTDVEKIHEALSQKLKLTFPEEYA